MDAAQAYFLLIAENHPTAGDRRRPHRGAHGRARRRHPSLARRALRRLRGGRPAR